MSLDTAKNPQSPASEPTHSPSGGDHTQVGPVAPEPIHKALVRQNKEFKRHIYNSVSHFHEHTERAAPLPVKYEVDPYESEKETARIRHPGHYNYGDAEPVMAPIADRLHEGKASLADLFRSYKHTPHAPASLFLKYAVHRVGNLAHYEDHNKAAELDQDFKRLHRMGGAADKNGHVSLEDLHGWLNKNHEVVANLLEHKKNLHEIIKKGIGLNIRDINGEPHVALTRGLQGSLMNREHALSSWADIPHTGFGSYQHHAWVPLKDIWYSYEIGPKRPNEGMGPENEILVANTAPRYEARPEDVKEIKRGLKASGGYDDFAEIPIHHFDNATDEEIAATVTKAKLPGGDPSHLIKHPNAGPRTFNAIIKNGYSPISLLEQKMAPREYIQGLINNKDRAPVPALKNPNLTTEDLHDFINRSHNMTPDHVKAIMANPNANEETARHIYTKYGASVDSDALDYGSLYRHPSTPHDILWDALEKNPRSHADILKNPTITPKMSDEIYKQASLHHTMFEYEHGAFSPETIKDLAKKKDHRIREYLQLNPNATEAHLHAALDASGEGDPAAINATLATRHKQLAPLPTSIQMRLLGHSILNRADMATCEGLAPEAVQAIAHDPKAFIRDNLFRNKSVSTEQLESAWPKGVPFPDNDTMDNADPDNALMDLARAIRDRKIYAARKQREHLIRPFPEGLNKSEKDIWSHQVRGWLDKQGDKPKIHPEELGYRFKVAHMKDASGNHEYTTVSAFHPDGMHQFGDDRVGAVDFWHHPDGHLVADQVWVHELHQRKGVASHMYSLAQDATEKEIKPSSQQTHSGSLFWLGKHEDDLIKVQTGLRFPKLGLGDDRRETPIINSPLEERTKVHAIANAAIKDPKFRGGLPDALAETDRAARFSSGLTSTTSAPINTSYSLGHKMRDAHPRSMRDPMTVINLPPQAPIATQVHENFHLMMNRVERKYGFAARQNLAFNMIAALPKHHKEAVLSFIKARAPRSIDGPFAHEEALTHLTNYLNNPGERVAFHRHFDHSHEERRSFEQKLKGAHKHLQAIADIADESWLGNRAPWRLGKSEYIDFLKEPELHGWESQVADAQLGHDKEIHAALKAAEFMAGGAIHDEDRYHTAMAVFDGDFKRAALHAYGLSDNEENLKTLNNIMEMHGLSKSEEETLQIESVLPATPDAEDVAQEIRRGIEDGRVQALHANGKHSKGMVAVRDPQTGHVWLLKPGSGRLSPAAGVREEKASQSAREAAFWHLAYHLGLGSAIPRTELLLINAMEVAAIKLLPPKFKSLDKMNREVPGYARSALEPYRENGQLFRWAILDAIAGNVDRHGSNMLVGDANSIALIDHGSSFAGHSFAPGHDGTKTFTPYYLRMFASRKFSAIPLEERVAAMPVLAPEQDAELGKFLQSIDPNQVKAILMAYGIDPEPTLTRLYLLQKAKGPVHLALNRFWVGEKP